MFRKIAPIVIVTVSLTLVGVSFFGSDSEAVEGWKLDPVRTQAVINAHEHDIAELIKAVETLEREVATLKKRKK